MVTMRGQLPPRMIQSLPWTRYPVTTVKGLGFVERWYHVKPVLSYIARLYQMPSKLIHAMGIIAITFVVRIGYDRKVIDQTLSSGYIKVAERPIKLLKEIQKKIFEMIGEEPRWIYA